MAARQSRYAAAKMSAARLPMLQEPCLTDQSDGRDARAPKAASLQLSCQRVHGIMAKQRRAYGSAESEGGSLVDWHEPAENMSVLDWRRRGRQFGLLPVDGSAAEEEAVVEPPDRLLAEEEPEAFA